MYQVIQLEGTIEPWWLFDELKEDVVSVQEFPSFYEALRVYKTLCQTYLRQRPQFDSREDLMAAFWDEDERVWCEECGDMLQEFHSLALLEDGHVVSEARYRPGYAHDTDHPFPNHL